MAKARKAKGLFISFEGGEGSGKSSQIARLKKRLSSEGHKVIVTREPGGTSAISREIRKLLLKPRYGQMADPCELLLYAADRAQNIHEIVLPALKESKIVLCDRHADSTTVYQGICRGFGTKNTQWLNQFSTGKTLPDLVFVLDVPVEVGLKRIQGRGQLDRMEKEEKSFHRKVRRGFLSLAKKQPNRYKVIDGRLPKQEITDQIYEAIQKVLRRKRK